jgi:hypothetical protein
VGFNSQVRYWRNPAISCARSRSAPAGGRLGAQGVQLFDANGNGRTDLTVIDGAGGPLPSEIRPYTGQKSRRSATKLRQLQPVPHPNPGPYHCHPYRGPYVAALRSAH